MQLSSVAVKPKREATTANMDHGNLICMEATVAVKPSSGMDVASKSIMGHNREAGQANMMDHTDLLCMEAIVALEPAPVTGLTSTPTMSHKRTLEVENLDCSDLHSEAIIPAEYASTMEVASSSSASNNGKDPEGKQLIERIRVNGKCRFCNKKGVHSVDCIVGRAAKKLLKGVPADERRLQRQRIDWSERLEQEVASMEVEGMTAVTILTTKDALSMVETSEKNVEICSDADDKHSTETIRINGKCRFCGNKGVHGVDCIVGRAAKKLLKGMSAEERKMRRQRIDWPDRLEQEVANMEGKDMQAVAALTTEDAPAIEETSRKSSDTDKKQSTEPIRVDGKCRFCGNKGVHAVDCIVGRAAKTLLKGVPAAERRLQRQRIDWPERLEQEVANMLLMAEEESKQDEEKERNREKGEHMWPGMMLLLAAAGSFNKNKSTEDNATNHKGKKIRLH